MPPKAKAAKGEKKAEEKRKAKVAEDKTFGLKNKHRSKQVQKFVQAVQTQATAGPRKKGPPTAQDERNAKKAAEAAHAEQLRKLFRPAQTKKDKEQKEKEGEEGDDAYAHLKDPEDYRWTAEDFEPVEQDDSRLEEQLEVELVALRARLAEEGGGTRVTEETFQIWKAQKRQQAVEAETKRKQRAVRTGQMTGRMLYEQNSAIFVDDEAGYAEYDRESEDDEDEEALPVTGAAGTGAASPPVEENGDPPADEEATGAIDSSLFNAEELEDLDDDEEEDVGKD